MNAKCPGQDTRYWKAEDIREEECPYCGHFIEFWKTDIRLRCDNCGNKVANPGFDLGCAQWCSYAEYCLGDIKRGYPEPETVKDWLKKEASGILGEEHVEKLQEPLKSAGNKAASYKAEGLLVIASMYLRILSSWPIQLNLVSENSKVLDSSRHVIAADCTSFAYPGFQQELLRGDTLLIGCPKLDDAASYLEKLTGVFKTWPVKEVTVVIMEVPCCSGMHQLVEKAKKNSGADFELNLVVVGINGEIKEERKAEEPS